MKLSSDPEFWCSFCFIPEMLFKLLLAAESVELYIFLPWQEMHNNKQQKPQSTYS